MPKFDNFSAEGFPQGEVLGHEAVKKTFEKSAQKEGGLSILELKKHYEEKTGEKCPYSDELLLDMAKKGFTLLAIPRGVKLADVVKEWQVTSDKKVSVGKFTPEGVDIYGRVPALEMSSEMKEEAEQEKKLRIERDKKELEERLVEISDAARRLIDAGWGVEKTIEEAVREKFDLENEE